jgi:predicted nucleic acid-binding protein
MARFIDTKPDIAAVEHYVDIRGTLEKAGSVISQPDLWIAAITRAAGGILVTNNTAEFSRVPGLMLEDWLQSRSHFKSPAIKISSVSPPRSFSAAS